MTPGPRAPIVRMLSAGLLPLLLLLVAGTASAHAVLQSAEPAPNGRAPEGVDVVVFRFTEDVEREFTGADVIDSSGASWAAGPVEFDDEAHNVLRLPVKPLPSGVYSASWKALSVDTHTTRGAFVFAVGNATLRGGYEPIVDQPEPGSVMRDGFARFAYFAGLFLAMGMPLFALAVLRDAPPRALFLTAAAFGAVGALGALVGLFLLGERTALGWGAVATAPGRSFLWRAGLVLAGAVACLVVAASPEYAPRGPPKVIVAPAWMRWDQWSSITKVLAAVFLIGGSSWFGLTVSLRTRGTSDLDAFSFFRLVWEDSLVADIFFAMGTLISSAAGIWLARRERVALAAFTLFILNWLVYGVSYRFLQVATLAPEPGWNFALAVGAWGLPGLVIATVATLLVGTPRIDVRRLVFVSLSAAGIAIGLLGIWQLPAEGAFSPRSVAIGHPISVALLLLAAVVVSYTTKAPFQGTPRARLTAGLLAVLVLGVAAAIAAAFNGDGSSASGDIRAGLLAGWPGLAGAFFVPFAAVLYRRTHELPRWKLGGYAASAFGVSAAIATALGSHAASSPENATLLIAADAVHLLMAAVWVGGIVAFLVVALRRDAPSLARLVMRFSPLAIASVVLLLATGTLASAAHMPCVTEGGPVACVRAAPTEPYTRLVLLKVALMAPLIALGAYNQQRVGPRLARNEFTPGAFRRVLALEAILMTVVVVAAGVLAASPPPPDAAERGPPASLFFEQDNVTEKSHVILQVSPNPVTVGVQTLTVAVHPLGARLPNGTLVALKVWAATDAEPDETLNPEKVSPNEWEITDGLFTTPGEWNVLVIVQRPDEYAKLTFTVPVAGASP